MSIRSIVAWIIAMLVLFVPALVSASCPVQQTAVIYVNGVDTLPESAQKSVKLLDEEIRKVPGVNPDCVVYAYAYNTNEPLFADFLEAGLQKVDEQKISTSDFWRFFLRHASPTLALLFDATIADCYDDSNVLVDLGEFILGDQKAEHLAKYREHLALGRKVILVGHSQGNLYANEEWDELLPSEQGIVRIVALLPVAITGGTLEGIVRNGSFTHPLSGAVVRILDRITDKVLLETTTDASGHYLFADVAPGAYSLGAYFAGEEVGYSGYVSITNGNTTTVNLPKSVPM